MDEEGEPCKFPSDGHGGGCYSYTCCWPRIHPYKYGCVNPVKRASKAGSIWTRLWRKLKNTDMKKRMMSQCILNSSSSTVSMRFTYDPHTYSQNFDDDTNLCADPDDLRPSFSARFAVPSTVNASLKNKYHDSDL